MTFVTEDQVTDLVRRAGELIDQRVAEAIALALRLYQPRAESPGASISAQFGQVTAVYPGYADVMYDTDTATTPVATLGTVAVGQRVCVLNLPPSGALIIASGGAAAPGGGSSGVGGAIVMWELPGPVIPVDAADSPNIPIVATGTVTGVTLSLDEPPAAGMSLVVDVFVNGVSIFSTKPTLAAGVALGYFAADEPVPVTANTDVVSAAVLTPAGRTLTIALS